MCALTLFNVFASRDIDSPCTFSISLNSLWIFNLIFHLWKRMCLLCPSTLITLILSYYNRLMQMLSKFDYILKFWLAHDCFCVCRVFPFKYARVWSSLWHICLLVSCLKFFIEFELSWIKPTVSKLTKQAIIRSF